MNDRPLVSVIIIFLNAEKFIGEAIESVLNQTYQHWELLLVDDGSSDGSTAIALSAARARPENVRYLEHPSHANRGMSASRNLGIAEALGHYVCNLDADDVLEARALEEQVAVLEFHRDAAMVYGPYRGWISWSGQPKSCDFIAPLPVSPNQLVAPPMLLSLFLKEDGVIPTGALFRREVLVRIKGYEESFRTAFEDAVVHAKICLEWPVYVAGNCWYRYRQHPESCLAVVSRAGDLQKSREGYLAWLQSYIKARGMEGSEPWRILRRELWTNKHPLLGKLERCISTSMRRAKNLPKRILRKTIPGWLRRSVRAIQLRRLRPWADGKQIGTPVVRHYWECFLKKYCADVRGHALEIGTIGTVRKWGGAAVTQADAIDLKAHSPEVTVVADLTRADDLPANVYDCFINQFTMHLIYDLSAALYHSIRMLKPGGVLLINFSCMDYYYHRGLDMGTGAPLYLYWWFTPIGVQNLLRHAGLSGEDYQMEIFGNLFARHAYQMNLPAEELTAEELNYSDPAHPLLICVRVTKPAEWNVPRPAYQTPWLPDTKPTHWNADTGHYVD